MKWYMNYKIDPSNISIGDMFQLMKTEYIEWRVDNIISDWKGNKEILLLVRVTPSNKYLPRMCLTVEETLSNAFSYHPVSTN